MHSSRMELELVHVTTRDGIVLAGAYFEPHGTPPEGVDAVVFLHGDGGNFYSPLYLNLGSHLATAGIACLVANRRGHDLVSHGVSGGPLAGYAFESVSDAPLDFRSWLDFLVLRGHTRVALGGHSGGAVRAVYAQATVQFPEAAAVVSVSPGEYRHAGVVGVHGADFVNAFERAEQLVEDAQPHSLSVPGLPWGSMWSAEAYVDCFNRDNRYSVSQHVANTGRPTLFTFGAAECEGPEVLQVCGLACADISAAQLSHVDVQVIAGANHSYQGRESELYEAISEWLVRLKK